MGIVGGLLHFFITKQHLCLGAACLLYWGEGAVPASVGSCHRPAHAKGPELGSLAWRLRPTPGAGTKPHAIGPVVTRSAPKLQDRAEKGSGRHRGVSLSLCIYFCSKGAGALGMKTSPTGSGCTSGDAARMSPTALGAALTLPHIISSKESTHLSGDSDTVVMAG